MKDRPILFSAPMICAILAGTKTQTRRALKLPRRCSWYAGLGGESEGWVQDDECPAWWHVGEQRCPYGKPGDRLWVRETWAYHTHAIGSVTDADGPWVYAADGERALRSRLCDRWRPSIHMPRAASRITLEITDVRVDRLRDIGEADAADEGVIWEQGQTAVHAFETLWESINGPGSWDQNPWVWIIEFKRLEGGAT